MGAVNFVHELSCGKINTCRDLKRVILARKEKDLKMPLNELEMAPLRSLDDFILGESR